jgi:hypothetical protein
MKLLMKNIFLIGLLIFTFYGCSEFLDVNENPNFPKEVDDYLVLPSAEASLASIMSADYGLLGSFWSQHWAQNNTSSQYKVFETYTLSSNDNRVDGPYGAMYSSALSDNEIILRKAEKDENWGLYLIASVIKAYGFQYLVDFYGNVPYNEAFNGEDFNFNPKIDNGEQVYDSIYTLLNRALSKDYSEFDASKYEAGDFFFGADLEHWVEFANTLKLRIILRQVEAKPEWVITELTNLLNDPDATFLSADVALTNFEDADSKSNPLFEADQRQLNTSNNIRANATFTTFLKANNDSRLEALFNVVGGNIFGMITGSYDVPNEEWEAPDFISRPKLTATMPVYLMTIAETNFLLAEAFLRIGDASEALGYYEVGVQSSFERMGAEIDDLLTTNYAFPATDFNAQLKAIIMQKWVDAAEGQRGMESFIDWVRTGYPEVAAPSVQAEITRGYEEDLPSSYIPGTLIYSRTGTTGGKFPVRLPYADSEINYNSNAAEYRALPDAEVMQTKVWWNK